ncbi:MAG: hypothetical protein JST30_14630 [Armatimonadetes bacterium]|nr:hypothetical protein [Armatimonadota bacterium]
MTRTESVTNATQEVAIKVRGEGFHGQYVKPGAQLAFVRQTTDAIRAATRLKTVHLSSAKGRPFRFLSSIWDLEQAPWQETDKGETLLVFRSPTLGDAAPKLFQQGVLFDEDKLNPDWTAFDLLGQVLNEVHQAPISELKADYGMLERVARFRGSFNRGLESACFAFSDQARRSAVIDQPLIERATEMLLQTPHPQRVRVVGRLDMLKMSDSLFQIILDDGMKVRGAWEHGNLDLRQWLGEDVLLEGMASFRANGAVVGVRADAARPASEGDRLFRATPKAWSPSLRLQVGKAEPGAFARIVGAWPGDETDQEVDAFLREIS